MRVAAFAMLLALAGVQDPAAPLAFDDQRLRVVRVAQQHQHAVEVRATLLAGDVLQRVQQLVDVAVGVAVLAGVTRRIQAGRAVQRIHADAGVVGQRG